MSISHFRSLLRVELYSFKYITSPLEAKNLLNNILIMPTSAEGNNMVIKKLMRTAAISDSCILMVLLLSKGFPCDKTTLKLAAERGCPETAKLLIDNISEVDKTDIDLCWLAYTRESPEMLKMFLNNGFWYEYDTFKSALRKFEEDFVQLFYKNEECALRELKNT